MWQFPTFNEKQNISKELESQLSRVTPTIKLIVSLVPLNEIRDVFTNWDVLQQEIQIRLRKGGFQKFIALDRRDKHTFQPTY